MKEVISFIKDYWQLILAAIVFILSFILQLIKKKPFNDIFSSLIPLVVKGVKFAEERNDYDVFTKSRDKLLTAKAFVLSGLCNLFGLELTEENFSILDNRFGSLIVSLIESILETPQKKGGSVDGK